MSLRNKFILVLLSMIVFVVSLLTYLNLKEDEKTFNLQLENRVAFMKKQMLKNAKYTIRYHADEIENDLASMSLSHIAKTLKQLVEREEIEGASLVSDNKEMQLFEGRPDHRSVDKETIEENKDNIIIATPIILSTYWGTFSLVYSLDTLNQEIEKAQKIGAVKKRNNIQDAIILAVFIFSFFGLLVSFWARKLLYPILLLTKSAQKMADGEREQFEELSHVDRNDEVGILAKTFQKMANKLDYSHKELQDLNESLEEKIRARTQDLESSKEELKILAATDPMTKLYNRRYFATISDKIFTEAKLGGNNIVLIMLDIDNFKKINDTYGHHIGDKVIISVAEILKERTRKSDIVCRYGGEEYMILLPQGTIEISMKIAENIRELVEQLTIELEHERVLSTTISIGISETNTLVDSNIEIAINKADNALYEAKRSGKNKVLVYSSN